MPPSARKPPVKPDEAKPAKDGDICPLCWPTGWPADGATAGCEHGTWTR